jgi:hypothetical protein
MMHNATWSLYAYPLDNPVMFVDEIGEWPGVTFMFWEAEIGGGLGYGINTIKQDGMAYDNIGKTKFTLVSYVDIRNQNLEEGSYKSQVHTWGLVLGYQEA